MSPIAEIIKTPFSSKDGKKEYKVRQYYGPGEHIEANLYTGRKLISTEEGADLEDPIIGNRPISPGTVLTSEEGKTFLVTTSPVAIGAIVNPNEEFEKEKRRKKKEMKLEE